LAFGAGLEGIFHVFGSSAGANTVTIQSVIAAGSGNNNAMTLSGNDVVILPVNNPFAGGAFVDGPTVIMGANSGMGTTGTATLTSGGILAIDANTRTISNPIAFNNSTFFFGAPGTGQLTFSAGSSAVGTGAASTNDFININSTVQFNSAVSGAGNLIKQGTA